MRAEQINEILISGDYKKKINLYLTELAGLNSEGEEFLTQEQRLQIVTNLKGKEIEYYNKLLQYNRAFIMYKNLLLAYSMSIKSYCYKIPLYFMAVNYEVILEERRGFIEAMDTSIKKAIAEVNLELKDNIPTWIKNIKYGDTLSKLNIEIAEFKEILEKSKTVLKKYLPLKPYQNYLKNLELDVTEVLNNLGEYITAERLKENIQAKANSFLSYPKFKRNKKNTPLNPDTEVEEKLSIAETMKKLLIPETVTRIEFSSVTGLIVYDKLTVKVYKVDIEEYINAGI
jgi:hypothetical protein